MPQNGGGRGWATDPDTGEKVMPKQWAEFLEWLLSDERVPSSAREWCAELIAALGAETATRRRVAAWVVAVWVSGNDVARARASAGAMLASGEAAEVVVAPSAVALDESMSRALLVMIGASASLVA